MDILQIYQLDPNTENYALGKYIITKFIEANKSIPEGWTTNPSDIEKPEGLIESEEVNYVSQLQAGLAQASYQVMQSNKQIEELTKQNAAMGFKIMQLEQNQNTESEGK